MERVGHFSTVKLVGGDASAKQADMTLYSYMLEARERGYGVTDFFSNIEKSCTDDAAKSKYKLQEMAWKQNINTAYSSSMGRLFDAAAALLDICCYNSYEGECAIKLEQAGHIGKNECNGLSEDIIHVNISKIDDVWQADSVKLLVDLYHLKNKCSQEVLAYLFHYAVASAIIEMTDKTCEEYQTNQIALSGGTFINRLLLTDVVNGLEYAGLQVYINQKVPCGDGGIALGQIYLTTFE